MGDKKLKEIYIVADKDLVELAETVVGKDYLVDFFYQPNKIFNDKTPYELCEKGETDKLKRTLKDILTAAHGG